MTCGPDDHLRPVGWLPAPRVHHPLLDITCAIGPVHHQSGWTGLLDLAGVLLACQPTGALLLFHGLAVALWGDRLLGPLPNRHPHHA
jgi:hypothetical protein